MPQCPYFSDDSQGAPCPSGGSAPGCRTNCPVYASIPPFRQILKQPERLALCPFTKNRCDVTDRPTPKVINDYRCCDKPCGAITQPFKEPSRAPVRPVCPFMRLVCPVPEPPPSSGGWAKCDAKCLTASEWLMASQWPPTIRLTPYIDRPAAGTREMADSARALKAAKDRWCATLCDDGGDPEKQDRLCLDALMDILMTPEAVNRIPLAYVLCYMTPGWHVPETAEQLRENLENFILHATDALRRVRWLEQGAPAREDANAPPV